MKKERRGREERVGGIGVHGGENVHAQILLWFSLGTSNM